MIPMLRVEMDLQTLPPSVSFLTQRLTASVMMPHLFLKFFLLKFLFCGLRTLSNLHAI